jgi:hypothetical protein
VGVGKLHRNFTDLRETGHDRRLPIQALASAGGRLLVAWLLATALLLAVGIWLAWRRRLDLRASLLLAGGIFAVFEVPFAFWRLDQDHILAAGLVPFSFLPMAVAMLTGMPAQRRLLVGGATALVMLLFLGTQAVRGNLHREVQLVLGKKIGYTVSYRGRSFIIGSQPAARDLQRMVDDVGARARPGQTLFVGPRDLRRTNENDVFVYYLLRDLEPASFYIELDPPASRAGSPLAGELQRADYLILTTRWDPWTEPNGSRRFGSSAPNEVVKAHFCVVDHAGTYDLLRRCR